jgi:hypothetical protein
MAPDITALYCCLDDFCKPFDEWEEHRLVPSEQTRQRDLTRGWKLCKRLFVVSLSYPLLE